MLLGKAVRSRRGSGAISLLKLSVIALVAMAGNANAQYQAASTGDGSLMIAVWDVETGATLVDRIQGFSLSHVATDPRGQCIDGTAGQKEGNGERSPLEFHVQQRLNGWDRFIAASSGDTSNIRYTVSAADDSSDCATLPPEYKGDEPTTAYRIGLLTAYKAIALTSNAYETVADIHADGDLNFIDVNDAAGKQDEYFGTRGPRGLSDADKLSPLWNGEVGVVETQRDRRSVLYPGDALPQSTPYAVSWSKKLHHGRTNAPVPTTYGLNWGLSLGHEWKGPHWPNKGETTGRIGDVFSADVTGQIGVPTRFWLFSLGWGAAGGPIRMESPVYVQQFPHGFVLDKDGCLTYDAATCQSNAFTRDTAWPQLPASMSLGSVSDVTSDKHGNIWVLHRPQAIDNAGIAANAAPAVLQFDRQGQLLQSWQIEVASATGETFSPKVPHGIMVDRAGDVWITLHREHVVLKFSGQGRLKLRIGEIGVTRGNEDHAHLGGPADVAIDEGRHELYVADGYVNNRVIVFDSRTGAYKRHWGAYGLAPVSSTGAAGCCNPLTAKTFIGPVHAIELSSDGRVYVADRGGTQKGMRVQSFDRNGKFLEQINQPALSLAMPKGKAQCFLLVAGRLAGDRDAVLISDRRTHRLLLHFGEDERFFGHQLAVDDDFNIYVAGLISGLHKFRPAKDILAWLRQNSSCSHASAGVSKDF